MNWNIFLPEDPWEPLFAPPKPRPAEAERIVAALTSPARMHALTRTEIGQIIQGLLRHAETLPDDAPPTEVADCA